jgi:hypothetical protein
MSPSTLDGDPIRRDAAHAKAVRFGDTGHDQNHPTHDAGPAPRPVGRSHNQGTRPHERGDQCD